VPKPQDTRRYRFELLGETVREIGLLLLVFVPLDSVINSGSLGVGKIIFLICMGIAGFILTYIGIRVEGRD
ncbi:MAG: hypothetical protein ACLPHI_04080, partial [Terriglobales bacterium]